MKLALFGMLVASFLHAPLTSFAQAPKPQPEVRIQVEKAQVTGATLYPAEQLEALIHPQIRGAHTLSELNLAAERIAGLYRADGWALVQVFLPPQTVQDGVLEIRVLEGALSELRIDNTSRMRTQTLDRWLSSLQLSKPVNLDQVNRKLLLLSDLPGIQVRSELTPGQAAGDTALRIKAQAEALLSGKLEIDNHGSSYLGQVRAGGKFNLNNPLGYGEQLNLQLLSSHTHLFLGNLSAQLPIGTNGLTLGTTLIRSQYQLGADFAQLDATGHIKSAGLFLNYPWIRSQAINLSSQISAETRSMQDVVGATDTRMDKRGQHFSLRFQLGVRDPYGGDNQAGLRISTGHLSLDEAVARAIDDAGAQTAGTYRTLELDLQRAQYFSPRWSTAIHLRGQFASKNLDSFNQFTLGGPSGVRAYPSGEATGDQGWLAQLELRYAYSPSLTPSLFLDAGTIEINKNPFLPGNNRRNLAGMGAGLRGSHQAFDWQAWLAWRLGGPPLSERDKLPRLWVQGSWRF